MSKKKQYKRTMPPRPQPKRERTILPIPEVLPTFARPVAIMVGPKTIHVFREASEIHHPELVVKLHALAECDERFDHVESNLRVKYVSRVFLAEFVMASGQQDAAHHNGRVAILQSALNEILSW